MGDDLSTHVEKVKFDEKSDRFISDGKLDIFSEKYKPRLPKDIVGNKIQIAQINTWLSNYDKNRLLVMKDPKKRKKIKIDDVLADDTSFVEEDLKNEEDNSKSKSNTCPRSCLVLSGDRGVGKTSTIEAILNHLEYEIKVVNLSKIVSNKDIAGYVQKIFTTSTVWRLFDENERKIKRAMIIDEIEAVSTPVEKNFILTLLKKNEEQWNFPIIFISNGRHSKITTALKKNANVVVFWRPSIDNMLKLFIKICENEKMHFESKEIAIDLINHCQFDMRVLVSTLQNFKLNHDSSLITKHHVAEYCEMIKMKDLDVDIYRAVSVMMANYSGIDDCLKLYDGEKVIIPLAMQENATKCIASHCSKSNAEKIRTAAKISRAIAKGDVIENYVHSEQSWDMQEVHGFLTCAYPAFYLNSSKLSIQNVEYFRRELVFPMDLNRTSIKKINKKNVINSTNCLKNFEVSDFIFLNKLIKKLIEEEKIEECAKLFQKYDFRIENIESILKIDKMTDVKTTLSSQTKKTLIKYLGINCLPKKSTFRGNIIVQSVKKNRRKKEDVESDKKDTTKKSKS